MTIIVYDDTARLTPTSIRLCSGRQLNIRIVPSATPPTTLTLSSPPLPSSLLAAPLRQHSLWSSVSRAMGCTSPLDEGRERSRSLLEEHVHSAPPAQELVICGKGSKNKEKSSSSK